MEFQFIKNYSENEIKIITDYYNNGMSYSEISKILKRKKDNIKLILKELNIWVEGRNNVKKEFNNETKEEIINHYKNGLNCVRISKIYGISKGPIIKILKEVNLLKKGNSNGQKIILTEDEKKFIDKMYNDKKKSPKEISIEIGKSSGFVYNYIISCDYKRNRSLCTSIGMVKRFSGVDYDEYLVNLTDFVKYRKEVMKITRKQPIISLPHFNERGISGKNGSYHLDHKFSIVEGYKQKINPPIIGDIKNLEFIPWIENVKKRTSCSIKKEELIKE